MQVASIEHRAPGQVDFANRDAQPPPPPPDLDEEELDYYTDLAVNESQRWIEVCSRFC